MVCKTCILLKTPKIRPKLASKRKRYCAVRAKLIGNIASCHARCVWKKGGTLDVEGYHRWVDSIRYHPGFAWALIPDVIDGSRRQRIARGSGTRVQDVNQLLKQFNETRKLMKQFSGMSGKSKRRMRLPGM